MLVKSEDKRCEPPGAKKCRGGSQTRTTVWNHVVTCMIWSSGPRRDSLNKWRFANKLFFGQI